MVLGTSGSGGGGVPPGTRRIYPTTRKPSEAEHYRYRPSTLPPFTEDDDRWFMVFWRRWWPPVRFGWRPARGGWGDRMVLFFDLALFGLVFLCLWTVFVGYHHFQQDLPTIGDLKEEYRPPTISYVLTASGRVMGEYASEYRIVVPYEAIPRHVVQAFVAAEDANFFQHPGVDLFGIFRAFIRNLQAGRIVQGGSTITQQVTRSFLLSRERSYRRKIREALLAWRLEKNLTKQEILYLYLNQIYLGEGAYGVEGAARTYFGKSVGGLTIAEAALIAGLTQAPSRYSPIEHPKQARARQRYVLRRMVESGFISGREAQEALDEEIVFRTRPEWEHLVAPQFMEQVRRQVEELVGADVLMNGGIRVYTTVDLKLQAEAEEALLEGLAELTRRQEGYAGPRARLDEEGRADFHRQLDREYGVRPLAAGMFVDAEVLGADDSGKGLRVRSGPYEGVIEVHSLKWALRGKRVSEVFSPGDVIQARARARDPEKKDWSFDLVPTLDVQGAIVCLDNRTGEVKAMIGGRDFRESQFNRAVQAKRQPGSAFKPFVYLAAMDAGYTPADILWDEPVEYVDEGSGEVWRPKNYDHNYLGPTTLYMGLVQSRNVIAVRLLEEVGIKRVIGYARKMGLTSHLMPYLSLALGASEVSLLEMVSAYSTFPNAGVHRQPLFIRRIENRDGRVIYRFPQRTVRVTSPETAFIVLDMMKGVVERGTGGRVRALGRPVAGKTGTTNDLADAWFIGFTPEYTAGVWVGHDKRKKLGRKESGGRAAAPIFLGFMKKALEGLPEKDFKKPRDVVYADIDPETGWLADEFALTRMTVCFRRDQLGPGFYSEYGTEDGVDDRPVIHVFMKDGRIYYYEEQPGADVEPEPGEGLVPLEEEPPPDEDFGEPEEGPLVMVDPSRPADAPGQSGPGAADQPPDDEDPWREEYGPGAADPPPDWEADRPMTDTDRVDPTRPAAPKHREHRIILQ